MPAAMASSPIIMPRPEKLKLNNAISPYRMSQIANNRKPILLRMMRMEILLSYLKEGRASGPATLVTRSESYINLKSITPSATPIDTGLQPFFFCKCKDPGQPPGKAQNGPQYG
jgi:hypothetical protein